MVCDLIRRGEKGYFYIWDSTDEMEDFLEGSSLPELSESRKFLLLNMKGDFY